MSQVLAERAPAIRRASLLPVAAAGLAGLGFVSLAVTQLVFPAQTDPFSRVSDYVIEYSYVVALWASVLAAFGLHRAHRARPRPLIFFIDTETTDIFTRLVVGRVICV